MRSSELSRKFSFSFGVPAELTSIRPTMYTPRGRAAFPAPRAARAETDVDLEPRGQLFSASQARSGVLTAKKLAQSTWHRWWHVPLCRIAKNFFCYNF